MNEYMNNQMEGSLTGNMNPWSDAQNGEKPLILSSTFTPPRENNWSADWLSCWHPWVGSADPHHPLASDPPAPTPRERFRATSKAAEGRLHVVRAAR